MNQNITSFYRLTESEKAKIVEQCLREIEEKKIRDTETIRKILEDILDAKWISKEKKAKDDTQKIVDELECQIAELSESLSASEEKAENYRTQLKNSDERCFDLRERLTDTEKKVESLNDRLDTAVNSGNILAEAYNMSDRTVEKMKKEKSENLAKIEELEEALKNKNEEADNSSSEAKKLRSEKRRLEREAKTHKEQKSTAWRFGLFVGIIATAGLCFTIFPTRYVEYQRVSEDVTDIYKGGANAFDYPSGFGELSGNDGVEISGFWANGALLYATEFAFSDGSTYSGTMNTDRYPIGIGAYTRPNGEKDYGIWWWADEKTVTLTDSETEYTYTGLMRFGKPYGYGVFVSADDGSIFSGEYYGGAFGNGTWLMPDGTTKPVTVY